MFYYSSSLSNNKIDVSGITAVAEALKNAAWTTVQ